MSDLRTATPCDLGKLLGEFERLVLDANDEQLPHRAVLPVTKRLNEVRAQILSLQSANVPALTDAEIAAAWNGAVPGSADKGVEMYLHCMRAVAEAQRRKITPSATEETTLLREVYGLVGRIGVGTKLADRIEAVIRATDSRSDK